jgi:hypothetical protein
MKKIILAAAVTALAVMAVAASASAGVDRYQVATGLKVTGNFNGTDYVHNYKLDSNCDGSFTGTGGMPELGLAETIHGTLDGSGNIVIDSKYETYNVPFNWHYSGPLAGGGTYTDPLGQAVAVTAEVTMSNFKNHGEFVASQSDKNDAAHSCIGMPVH